MPPSEAEQWSGQVLLARRLTALEHDPALAWPLILQGLRGSRIPRWGVTGSPGVGKSTFIAQWLQQSPPVRRAVIAVDPTSPFSGGALLGDRLRIGTGGEAFVRSMASRGSLGGMSPLAIAAVALLEESGFEEIVVETVGLGQVGFDIAALATTVIVLLSPESGDTLQLQKAGLLEFGDIFVINKSDRPGAELLAASLREALHEAAGAVPTADMWQPPVLTAVSTQGLGMAEIVETANRHRLWLADLDHAHPVVHRQRRLGMAAAVKARLDLEFSRAMQLQEARGRAAAVEFDLAVNEIIASLGRTLTRTNQADPD